jgi:hypothetical protein
MALCNDNDTKLPKEQQLPELSNGNMSNWDIRLANFIASMHISVDTHTQKQDDSSSENEQDDDNQVTQQEQFVPHLNPHVTLAPKRVAPVNNTDFLYYFFPNSSEYFADVSDEDK